MNSRDALYEIHDLREQLDRTTRLVGSLYKICSRLEKQQMIIDRKTKIQESR